MGTNNKENLTTEERLSHLESHVYKLHKRKNDLMQELSVLTDRVNYLENQNSLLYEQIDALEQKVSSQADSAPTFGLFSLFR